jgi:hypothetical protein
MTYAQVLVLCIEPFGDDTDVIQKAPSGSPRYFGPELG